MSAPTYHVLNTSHGWSVVRDDCDQNISHAKHLGLAETLSEAVLIANEDAGRELTFAWADDFKSGEGA